MAPELLSGRLACPDWTNGAGPDRLRPARAACGLRLWGGFRIERVGGDFLPGLRTTGDKQVCPGVLWKAEQH